MIIKFKIFENFTLEQEYDAIYGEPNPKNKKALKHKEDWINQHKRNKKNIDFERVEDVEDEMKRMAFTGEASPYYRTMENTYEDVEDLPGQQYIDEYMQKNNIENEDDRKKMLDWVKFKRKKDEDIVEPNTLGKEQKNIPHFGRNRRYNNN
jgi:hypothetical protein